MIGPSVADSLARSQTRGGRPRIATEPHRGTSAMRWASACVALILAVGITASVIALGGREANSEFVAQQRALAPVSAAALQQLIATTSDPRPGYGGRALGARCSTQNASALGSPWTCVVRYPRPPLVRYRVIVDANRSIHGSGVPEGAPLRGALTLSGCCVGSS